MSEKVALIVVDHGSRRPDAGAVLQRVVEHIQSLGRFQKVIAAHMDIEQPSICEAIKAGFRDGADRVVIVPFMLSPGRHSIEDIPRLARDCFPDAQQERIFVTEPLGDHPGVVEAVLDRARKAMGKSMGKPSLLLSRQDAALLVIDLQTGLLPHIENGDQVVSASRYLIRAAAAMNLPLHVSEQYRKGLGPTDPRILNVLPQDVSPMEKMCFGAFGAEEIQSRIGTERRQIIMCGVEAHICVLQSALQAIERGFKVYIAADAVGSRCKTNYDAALKRMQEAGVTLVTAEMVAYELLKEAGTPAFKALLPMLKQGPYAVSGE